MTRKMWLLGNKQSVRTLSHPSLTEIFYNSFECMEAPDGTASHTKQINETIPMSANTGAQNCMSAA